jgi:hypothetical protein
VEKYQGMIVVCLHNLSTEAAMNFLTLEQLQQAYAAGEISAVTLHADGSEFEVRIAAHTGQHRLADATSGGAGRFSNPADALLLLSRAGIKEVRIIGDDAERRKIRKALAGHRDGSNRSFSSDEWERIRASKRAQRDGA